MDDLLQWREQHAPEIVGESDAIITALEIVRHVADTTCTLLITGETGTGKELFARAAHRASSRRGQAFIPVNCAAIPDTLLETELFGHIKGAFTGATNARNGRFMSAHGGTIFLDEIGDMPLPAQAKLLRVLEERVVTPVGSDSDIPVDVRVIAATHRNLAEMVEKGQFRADLYYRLSVVPVALPALRERRGDVEYLANACIARHCARLGRPKYELDPTALARLRMYPWPGNVRELAHTLERTVLLARRGVIRAEDLALREPVARGSEPAIPRDELDAAATGEGDSLDLRAALERLERDLISVALRRTQGNRTEAAALLGLNRTTLVEKLRKYAA